MLRAARQLGRAKKIEVRTSFLGAHAVPPEFAGRADDYVDHIINDMLPAVAAEGLADSVDAFCRKHRFFQRADRQDFRGCAQSRFFAEIACRPVDRWRGCCFRGRLGALSADHLEYTSEDGARAMGEAGTVAVLLPGAYATVGAVRPPPVAWFRSYGVGMAVATDCNPGSSPHVFVADGG